MRAYQGFDLSKLDSSVTASAEDSYPVSILHTIAILFSYLACIEGSTAYRPPSHQPPAQSRRSREDKGERRGGMFLVCIHGGGVQVSEKQFQNST